jgi:hypothetical protein
VCRGWHCLLRLSRGGRPAGTGRAQEALDAAEAEIVSDCEDAGGGSGAVGACHGSDHVVGESFAKASRCRGCRFGLWPSVPCGREDAKPQVSGLRGVRVSGKYLHPRMFRALTRAFMLLRCASPFSLPGKRRDSHPVRQRTVSAHADGRSFDAMYEPAVGLYGHPCRMRGGAYPVEADRPPRWRWPSSGSCGYAR